jgi:hypothetical protein
MPNRQVELVGLRIITIPNINLFGGCEPWFRIENNNKEFISKVIYYIISI